MAKTKTQPCVSCATGTMRYERRDDVVAYQQQERHLEVQGWWCDSCGEAIFDGAALAERERAFLELKAEVDEVLGPEQVAAIRKQLGLSQRSASELLGGGPHAFQKYESGKQAVSVPMSNLLYLLANDPTRLREIQRLRPTRPRGGARNKASA
jgi:HTH-type transcriptional regulator/antitoxin MqsA